MNLAEPVRTHLDKKSAWPSSCWATNKESWTYDLKERVPVFRADFQEAAVASHTIPKGCGYSNAATRCAEFLEPAVVVQVPYVTKQKCEWVGHAWRQKFGV